jgi:hypothetical protein
LSLPKFLRETPMHFPCRVATKRRNYALSQGRATEARII